MRKQLTMGKQIVAIFMHSSKAFDKVSHKKKTTSQIEQGTEKFPNN